jgi:hypothetical protein
MLQPRRVADGVFCSEKLKFWLLGVLQHGNVTATRIAELLVMRAV